MTRTGDLGIIRLVFPLSRWADGLAVGEINQRLLRLLDQLESVHLRIPTDLQEPVRYLRVST